MDGIEATKKIRNSVREDNDVPIFAMTANTFATDRKRCADAGMTRVYSETGELKRNSDDAGRESADVMRRITGRINNRKIWTDERFLHIISWSTGTGKRYPVFG